MTLRINGSTSGYTEIDAPATAGNNTLVLPTGNGSSGQFLSTNGSGTLSWANTPSEVGALYYRLNSDIAGSNVSTAQSLFGVGVTLAASTVYEFQAGVVLQKSAGVTGHQVQFLFGGTATVNNFSCTGVGGIYVGTIPGSGTTNNPFQILISDSATTALNVSPSIAVAAAASAFTLRGTVSVNASGTFIPQYQLTAAPGGAYSTKAGSYIRFIPIGTAGSNSSQGTWS